jgi:nitrilase
MARFKAAVVQTAPVGGDTLAAVSRAVEQVAECGRQGAQVAVFPEAYIGGYPKGANFSIFIGARTPEGREEFKAYHDQAISVPGPEIAALGKAAKAAKLYLTIGVIEREGGALYCTALFFGPEGDLLGKHHKTMPMAAERLCWGFGDGSTPTTVETPWGAMGSVICWENSCRSYAWRCMEKGFGSTARRPRTTGKAGLPPCSTLLWKAAVSCCRRANI